MARAKRQAGQTRHQITVAAATLFAERGFHGTSTRDIAEAVGVRQPTIYSHFATKHLILATLVDADLIPALSRIQQVLQLEGPVAPRLHAYLRSDVAAILRLPFDVRGLYNDEALRSPELAAQAARRTHMHDLTRQLIQAGIDAGELDVDPGFVQYAITGLLLEVMRERGADQAAVPIGRALDIADFVVKAALADPAALAGVRRASSLLSSALTPDRQAGAAAAADAIDPADGMAVGGVS